MAYTDKAGGAAPASALPLWPFAAAQRRHRGRLAIAGQRLQDRDKFRIGGGSDVAQLARRMRVGEMAQLYHGSDALAARRLQLRRPPDEQDLVQLAVAEEVIQLGHRRVDEKKDENPDLRRREFLSGKILHEMAGKGARRATPDQVADEFLDEPREEDHDGIDDGLE